MVSTQRGTRPVSAPVFSQAALAEAGIPMAPFDQPQTSTPIKTTRKEERKLEVTVEAVEPSKLESVGEAKVVIAAFMFRCFQIISPGIMSRSRLTTPNNHLVIISKGSFTRYVS